MRVYDVERSYNCPFKTQAELDNYLKQRVYPFRSKWYGYSIEMNKFEKQELRSIIDNINLQLQEDIKKAKCVEIHNFNFSLLKRHLDKEYQKYNVDFHANRHNFAINSPDFIANNILSLFFTMSHFYTIEKKGIENLHISYFEHWKKTYKQKYFDELVKIFEEYIEKNKQFSDKRSLYELMGKDVNEKLDLLDIKNEKDDLYNGLCAIANNKHSSKETLNFIELLIKDVKDAQKQRIIFEALEIHKNYEHKTLKNRIDEIF